MIRSLLPVQPLTVGIHATELGFAERYGLSPYDAMIAASALHADCDTLWSEDMQDGIVLGVRSASRARFARDDGGRERGCMKRRPDRPDAYHRHKTPVVAPVTLQSQTPGATSGGRAPAKTFPVTPLHSIFAVGYPYAAGRELHSSIAPESVIGTDVPPGAKVTRKLWALQS